MGIFVNDDFITLTHTNGKYETVIRACAIVAVYRSEELLDEAPQTKIMLDARYAEGSRREFWVDQTPAEVRRLIKVAKSIIQEINAISDN